MILLIDGRSGSGKTTFAAKLRGVLGWPVLHVEDAYPGWDGLAAGSATVGESMLDPGILGFRRWDWYADDWAEWVPTPVGPAGSAVPGSLIIEGCGALTEANLAAACRIGDGEVWGVWLDLDAETRHARAMARDPEFDSHWGMWARQEDEHYSVHRPWDLAEWIVRVR